MKDRHLGQVIIVIGCLLLVTQLISPVVVENIVLKCHRCHKCHICHRCHKCHNNDTSDTMTLYLYKQIKSRLL